jgi:hypothetical protein
MRLYAQPVYLPNGIRGLGFLKHLRVSFRFVPLHYCKLRQQATRAKEKPNEQVEVEAAFGGLPDNSWSFTKLAITVLPHYEGATPPELELLNIIRADAAYLRLLRELRGRHKLHWCSKLFIRAMEEVIR